MSIIKLNIIILLIVCLLLLISQHNLEYYDVFKKKLASL